MKKLSRNAMIGYPAGIITGITYGLNPLFGTPLMNAGASVESILFFRYGFAVLLLGAFLWLSKQSFRITMKQREPQGAHFNRENREDSCRLLQRRACSGGVKVAQETRRLVSSEMGRLPLSA